MEKEPLGIFFGSLVEGISDAQKAVRAVNDKALERTRRVTRSFLIFSATEKSLYRRRLRVA
jgi:hypothetical protein